MSSITRMLATPLAAIAFTFAFACATVAPATAQERVETSVEFRTALQPYGEFRQHQRWGEVWVPTHLSRGWQPYTVGHWADTEDYGWYWISDETEADWGWITFHYGRWVFDADWGWIWIPGNVWGPGFVNWRRGTHRVRGRVEQYVGWAPEPPDEMVVEVREDVHYWVFVRARDFVAVRIVDVVVPPPERVVLIRETVVENRTVILEDRGFAVNPGIPPVFVAAAVGRPIPTYQVRPVVLAGTANVPGATFVRAEELRERRDVVRQAMAAQPTNNMIQPTANVPPPQPLPANARQGRLDLNPPRAAQGAAGTTGVAPPVNNLPAAQSNRPGEQRPNAQPSQPPPAAQGPQRERGGAQNLPQNPQQNLPRTPSGTTGQAPAQPSAQPNPNERRGQGAQQRERGGGQNLQQNLPRAPSGTTGQAPGQPSTQPTPNERRGHGAQQRERGGAQNLQQNLPRTPSGTTGQAPGQSSAQPNPDERRGHGTQRERGGPQNLQQNLPRTPSPTTGQAPSQPSPQQNLGDERRGPGAQRRERGGEQIQPDQRGLPSLREPGQRRGTTGAAPAGPREPNLNMEPRREPPAPQNRGTAREPTMPQSMPHERNAPSADRREGVSPAARGPSHEPSVRGPELRPPGPAAQTPHLPAATTGAGPAGPHRGGGPREEPR